MGLVLAILTPKIKEFRDRTIIEQSIDSLNVIDSKINEILDAPGNKRRVELTIEKGKLAINASQNTIYFIIDEAHTRYSEPGLSLDIGRINVTTEKLTETYRITLELNYGYNLTFGGAEGDVPELVEFTPVSLPYKFFVENRGIQNNNLWIDITEGS